MFLSNYPNETMSVLYAEGPNTQVSLQNCEFSDNVAKEASDVVQLLSAVTISLLLQIQWKSSAKQPDFHTRQHYHSSILQFQR